jgi:hypothetical protein
VHGLKIYSHQARINGPECSNNTTSTPNFSPSDLDLSQHATLRPTLSSVNTRLPFLPRGPNTHQFFIRMHARKMKRGEKRRKKYKMGIHEKNETGRGKYELNNNFSGGDLIKLIRKQDNIIISDVSIIGYSIIQIESKVIAIRFDLDFLIRLVVQ